MTRTDVPDERGTPAAAALTGKSRSLKTFSSFSAGLAQCTARREHLRSQNSHSAHRFTEGETMRRRLIGALPLVVASASFSIGCGGTPVSYFSLTPQPSADAYTCAIRKVNELGYTVTNTNKDAGFITADKQMTGAMHKVLLGSEEHDQLTVSIFDDPATQQRKLRVTAAATTASSNLFGTKTSAKSPSDAAMADANALLSACAEGPITKQAYLPHSLEAVALGN
jgi:hypothetical protein